MTYVYDYTLQRVMVKDESLKAIFEKNQNHDFLKTSCNGFHEAQVEEHIQQLLSGYGHHFFLNSHRQSQDQ